MSQSIDKSLVIDSEQFGTALKHLNLKKPPLNGEIMLQNAISLIQIGISIVLILIELAKSIFHNLDITIFLSV